MAIRLDKERTDAQGLPVVTWEEDRNLFAPGGISPARVACFIQPDAETGVMQFVSAGLVRHGEFVEARPPGRSWFRSARVRRSSITIRRRRIVPCPRGAQALFSEAARRWSAKQTDACSGIEVIMV
jgi:hypothetical protein